MERLKLWRKTGNKIVIVEATAEGNLAKKAGETTVTSK